MDAFSDNNVFDSEVDPAADFLAREQNALAGLEDEIKTGPVSNDKEGSVHNHVAEDLSNDVSFDESQERNQSSPVSTIKREHKEEAEKISKWRQEQLEILSEKDKQEEKKKEEWRIAAKKELEEWYKHHEELINKTRAANRNADKQFVAYEGDIEPGTEWERIAKLCDFNKKSTHAGKDASRMRSIILQLKSSGVKSYIIGK